MGDESATSAYLRSKSGRSIVMDRQKEDRKHLNDNFGRLFEKIDNISAVQSAQQVTIDAVKDMPVEIAGLKARVAILQKIVIGVTLTAMTALGSAVMSLFSR